MQPIPLTKDALILRTDFSDQAAWERICSAIQEPVGEFRFRAYVEFLDETQYADLSKDQLLELIPADYNHMFIMVVDKTTFSHPEHPLLIIDLYERSGHAFRAIPSQIQGIENNLSIANIDFEEFAQAVDEDGVFRGFPEP